MLLTIEFQHRAGFHDGGKFAFLHVCEERRGPIGGVVGCCYDAGELVILAHRVKGLHIGGGDADKGRAFLVKLGGEFLAVAVRR